MLVKLLIIGAVTLLTLPYIAQIAWSICDVFASLFFDWLDAWKDFICKVFCKGDD